MPASSSAGHRHLGAAHRVGILGRFQLEAAIAAVHCARKPDQPTDWELLHRLHGSLQHVAPSLGGEVALATVRAEVDGAAAGLSALDHIADRTGRFQPAWSAKAHLLDRLGRRPEARDAYARAIDLSADPAERDHLAARRARLVERPD